MITLPDIMLFGMATGEPYSHQKGLASRIRILGSPPKTFLLGLFIALGVLLITYEQSMLSLWRQRQPLPLLLAEFLFHSSVALLILSSQAKQVNRALLMLVGSCIINALLNTFYQTEAPSDLFRNHWGNFGFWACCCIAFYRFPFRWASLMALLSMVLLIETNGAERFSLADGIDRHIPFLVALSGEAFFCILGCIQRSRAVLFLELQEVQAQLHLQIQRTEELATTRERTRIARDIHDVLAHSLTILSIQVQAARQLIHKDPERLATRLEEMASLLRESIAESRRVVGLLRELPALDHAIETSLQSCLKRFEKQTGITCLFEEKGQPRSLGDEQRTTLLYALQEALTNAHRHGQAQMVWTSITWQDHRMILQIRDNGHTQSPQQPLASAPHGHHGLQGMRERATAMGGKMQAEALADGGFQVTLELPFHQPASFLKRM